MPLALGNQLHQIGFDLGGGAFFAEPEPLAEPAHVGVHGDAGVDAKTPGQHHRSGFTGHPRKHQQLLHGLGHLTAVVLHEQARAAHDRLGLVAKKASGLHVGLHIARLHRGGRGGIGEAGKQGRGHLVDPLIGALGRQHGGHQQFVGRAPIQGTGGLGIELAQPLKDERRAHLGTLQRLNSCWTAGSWEVSLTISTALNPTKNTKPDCIKAIWKRSGRGLPRTPSSSSSTN